MLGPMEGDEIKRRLSQLPAVRPCGPFFHAHSSGSGSSFVKKAFARERQRSSLGLGYAGAWSNCRLWVLDHAPRGLGMIASLCAPPATWAAVGGWACCLVGGPHRHVLKDYWLTPGGGGCAWSHGRGWGGLVGLMGAGGGGRTCRQAEPD